LEVWLELAKLIGRRAVDLGRPRMKVQEASGDLQEGEILFLSSGGVSIFLIF